MQKQIKILLTLLTALILAVSCANPSNPNDKNNNTSQSGNQNNNNTTTTNNNQTVTSSWKENPNFKTLANIWQGTDLAWTGEIYEIKDNGDKGVEFLAYNTYTITVEEIVWDNGNTSGMIYGKYTYSWDPNSIGKYYAVSFKNLTSTSVDIAGAWDRVNNVWTADSLQQAKEIFTVEKGSFAEYTSCVPYTGNK